MATIDDILNDIYELDPSLRERDADVRRMVSALLAARPHATPDRAFVEQLREQMSYVPLAVTRQPQPTESAWVLFLLRMATPVAAVAVLLLILLPSIAPGPGSQYYAPSYDSGAMGGDGGRGTMSAVPAQEKTAPDQMESTMETMMADDSMMTMEAAPIAEPNLGFIRSVDAEHGVIIFDDAQWLSGRQAEDAAIAYGLCTEETRGECLPNDYFIANSERTTIRLTLDPTHTIVMQTWNAGTFGIQEQEISLQQFAALINDESLHWNQLPYRLTTENGFVTRIEEVYIP